MRRASLPWLRIIQSRFLCSLGHETRRRSDADAGRRGGEHAHSRSWTDTRRHGVHRLAASVHRFEPGADAGCRGLSVNDGDVVRNIDLRLPTILSKVETDLNIDEFSQAPPYHGVAGGRIIGAGHIAA